MKAEERHRLKTNELQQALSQLPEYLRQHGRNIAAVGMLLAAVLIGVFWLKNSRASANQQQSDGLQELIVRAEIMQINAAQRAQLGQSDQADGQGDDAYGELNSESYDSKAIVKLLAKLAEDAAGKPIGATALLAQADAIRSQLIFTDYQATPEETQQANQQAEELYRKVLAQYPADSYVAAGASLGLGLLAEERGQWQQARQIYEQIIAEKAGKLAGTTAPAAAQLRLNILEDIEMPIEFPEPVLQILPQEAQAAPPEILPGQLESDLAAVAPEESTVEQAQTDQ